MAIKEEWLPTVAKQNFTITERFLAHWLVENYVRKQYRPQIWMTSWWCILFCVLLSTIEMTSNGAGYLNEIFNKRNFKYSGAMLWNNLSCEEKTAQSLFEFKTKLASLPSAGSLWFHNLYVYVFQTYTSYSSKLPPSYIVKPATLCTLLRN